MTMNLNGTPGRFTGNFIKNTIKSNKIKEERKLSGIKSQLVGKTFEEIKKIVKNIGDHPNPNLLIENLGKNDNFENTKELLAKAIKNSTYSVDKILNIKK